MCMCVCCVCECVFVCVCSKENKQVELAQSLERIFIKLSIGATLWS